MNWGLKSPKPSCSNRPSTEKSFDMFLLSWYVKESMSTDSTTNYPFLYNSRFLKLWICAGKTEEDFERPLNIPSESLSFPEHHDGNFNEWNYFEALQQLMTVCGYYEFSWRDLYHPEPKRLRLQLSAVINLAKYRESQLVTYSELREPVRLLLFVCCHN